MLFASISGRKSEYVLFVARVFDGGHKTWSRVLTQAVSLVLNSTCSCSIVPVACVLGALKDLKDYG